MQEATSDWEASLLLDDGKMSAPSDCGRVPQLRMLARWRRELFIDDSYTGTEAMVSKKRKNNFDYLTSFFTATEDDELSSVNTTSRQRIFRQLVMVASDDPLRSQTPRLVVSGSE